MKIFKSSLESQDNNVFIPNDDRIGDIISNEGASRIVYENLKDPTTVIKVHRYRRLPIDNITEWDVWWHIKETKMAKWLAPVVDIDNTGMILTQKKTSPLDHKNYPTQLPIWLTDRKYANFGIYEGHFVVHDYGLNLLYTYGISGKMTKAVWNS